MGTEDILKDFIITSDTTCDLSDEYVAKNNIRIIPLCYVLDDVIYGIDKIMDIKEFYDTMRGGKMPTTMAGSPEDIRNIFTGILDEGYDILHISFSSALSSSYNNATVVAGELKENYPDADIRVVDSLCASLGEGLLVHKAVRLKAAGASLDDVFKWLEENKLNLCHQFTVDDLHHLHRGGRVSKTAAVVGTLINVKPVLHVDDGGRLIPLNNVRGRKKSLISLVDNMEKAIKDYDGANEDVFIGHGDAPEDARFVADMVKSRFGIENITIGYISPTVGAHSGPGTIALFFMGSKR